MIARIGFILLALTACAGRIETAPIKSLDASVNGIVYYAPTYVKIRYVFSVLVDKNGKLLGTAEG